MMGESTTVGPYATPADIDALTAAIAQERAERIATDEKLAAAIGGGGTPPDPTEKLYVAPTGNNANNGSFEHPFRDVNEGLKRLGPNVSVNIRAGTYLEEIISPQGGTESQPAIVRAYQGEMVTLQPGTGRSRCITLENQRSQYIIWEALHLDAVHVTYDVVKLTYGGTDKANAAHHITFKNCELKNSPRSQGILITNESHHNLVEGGSIHDCGLQTMDDLVHGFYLAGSDNILRGIEVYRCAGSAGQVYCSTGGAHRNLIEDCHFHDCALGGPQKRPMVSMASGTGSRIVNTRMIGNGMQYGVDFMGSSVENEIAGGHLSGFPGAAVLIEPGAQRTKVTNVGFANNGKNVANQGTGSIITP